MCLLPDRLTPCWDVGRECVCGVCVCVCVCVFPDRLTLCWDVGRECVCVCVLVP